MSANTETTGGPEGYGRCYRCATAFHKKTQAMCWRCWDAMSPGTCIGDVRRTVGPDWTPPIAAPAAHVERRKGQVWRFIGCGMSEELTLARLVTAPRERWEDTNGQAWWFGPEDMHEFVLLADATPEPEMGVPHPKGCRCKQCEQPIQMKSLPAQEAPKQWQANARCGFPIVSTNREAVVTAVGKHQATCEKCNAQEAPNAAPVPSCMWKHATTPCAGPIAIRYVGQAGKREPHGWCEGHMLEYERQAAARPGTGEPYAGPERLPRPQLAADWVEDCLEDAR